MIDYFEVFGVKRTASDREIREAYRRLAKKFHPDPHPNDPMAERRMQEINEAKAVLFDPVRREQHRAELRSRETITAERLEELRNNSRFQGTTTYTPRESRRPRSKWDRHWKKYMFGLVALLILAATGIISYEIGTNKTVPSDPIKALMERYASHKPLVTDSAAIDRDTLSFPDDTAPKLRRMGDILFGLGEYRSAAKYYEMYLKKAPENDTVLGNLSYAYFKEGRYAQTLEILSHEMKGDSNLVTAYYNVGELFLREEKPFDARDAFRASVRIADSMVREGRHPPDDARLAAQEIKRIP